jgi:putative flavoprotein involved in K+ transport
MGYFLHQKALSFTILEKSSEIGEVWRDRYDSLKLFTPRYLSVLPGLPLDQSPNTYPTKDEIADYLRRYKEKFSLQVQLNSTVQRMYCEEDAFNIETEGSLITARNVVVATGPFQRPRIPRIATFLSSRISQFHSSEYRNATQLKEGSVLVVGGGNSGAQIAVELAKGRDVILSVGHPMSFLPQDIGNKSIFWYFEKLGIYKAPHHSLIGKRLKNRPDPIFGKELKTLIKHKKIKLKPRAVSTDHDFVIFQDNSKVLPDNIIWATGFAPDYQWIEIPEIFSPDGWPNHTRGVTNRKGLYFLGLPWQYSRSSALIHGVGIDARYLSDQIIL